MKISGYICLIISLLSFSLPACAQVESARKKSEVQANQSSEQPKQQVRGIQYVPPTKEKSKKENIRLFQGMAVSADLAGAVMYGLASYGQLEGQLRINLKEKYFPVGEIGIGHSDHTNKDTNLHYTTNSPYIRLGCDINFNKDKASKNRIYGGFRYAFSSFKFDLSGDDMTDPVWGTVVPFNHKGLHSNVSWLELVFGLEANIYKNFHLGWSARYKRRLRQSTSSIGQAWYVPGFGKNNSHNLGATFNIIFDI